MISRDYKSRNNDSQHPKASDQKCSSKGCHHQAQGDDEDEDENEDEDFDDEDEDEDYDDEDEDDEDYDDDDEEDEDEEEDEEEEGGRLNNQQTARQAHQHSNPGKKPTR